MGLFKKVKDILFDEEEDYTEQIKITPEMRNETPKKEEAPVVKKVEPTVQKDATLVEHSEKEVFKNNAFPFWDDFVTALHGGVQKTRGERKNSAGGQCDATAGEG